MTERPPDPQAGPQSPPPGSQSPPPGQQSPPGGAYPAQHEQSPPPAHSGHGSPSQGSNGLAVAALAVGIAALIFAFLFFPLGLVLGIAAIVLGVMGRRRATSNPALGRGGMALAGLILGVISTLISLLIIILLVIGISALGGLGGLEDEVQQQQQQLEQQQGN